MPLKQGYSEATKSENIAEMERAGYPHKQAIAAAISTAIKAKLKARASGKDGRK